MHDPEPRTEGRGEQARARRGADQRERLERHLDRARAGTLPDDDVELVVLQGRIEDFLDDRAHAVNLVDEEHLVRLEIRQQRGEVSRPLQHGAGGRTDLHLQLLRNDVGERGLAQARRTVQQHVIERFPALPGRLDRHGQVLAHALLADVVRQRARPETRLVLQLLGVPQRGDDPLGRRRLWLLIGHFASSRSAWRNVFSNPAAPDPDAAFTARSATERWYPRLSSADTTSPRPSPPACD